MGSRGRQVSLTSAPQRRSVDWLLVDALTAPAALAWAVTSSTGQGSCALDVTLTVVDATSGSVRRQEQSLVEGVG